MKCFLLSGQSNMAGRGNIEDVPKIFDNRIKMLRGKKWVVMEEPIHTDSANAGIGPAASFASKYVEKFNEPIGLIPCAVGGTSITQWQRGKKLFCDMIENINSIGKDDEIIGVLWAQGETDSRIFDNANNYDVLFMKVLDALCKNYDIKNIPIILSDIPQFYHQNPAYKYSGIVSNKIKEICGGEYLFGFVKTDGLTCKEDGLHYNSKSYRELGNRFFDEYLLKLKEAKGI